jgi:hypothetical protein
MSTARDLDQFCEPVANLSFGKATQELEVEKGVHGGMIRSKTVLVVSVVHGDFNTDASINQADDSRWDTNEVCVPSVRSTSKSAPEC